MSEMDIENEQLVESHKELITLSKPYKNIMIVTFALIGLFISSLFGTQFWLDLNQFTAFVLACMTELINLIIMVFWSWGYRNKIQPRWLGALILLPFALTPIAYCVYLGLTSDIVGFGMVISYCFVALFGVLSFISEGLLVILILCPGMLGEYLDQ